MKADIDKFFPRNGPCMFHPTRYARHRVVDAIRGRYAAGESVPFIARDVDLPRAAVLAAVLSTPDDSRMTQKEIREAWAERYGPDK